MTDTPSLVPLSESSDVYLVVDELPTFGRVWRELSEETANEQTVLELIANGDFHGPVRVIAFNTTEGWSRDVTEDIAEALLEREARAGDLSQSARIFVGRVLHTRDMNGSLQLSEYPRRYGAPVLREMRTLRSIPQAEIN